MTTNGMTIRRATRTAAKLRLALDGPAGSGKTHSALRLAAGLGRRICLIDTEEGSGELEAGKPGIPEYDYLPLSRPYSPERYVAALELAARDHDVVVVDGLSHAWAGSGGVLEMHDLAAKSGRGERENRFTAWRDVTPAHNRLVDALLACPAHVIATMRTKTEYEVVDGKPKKVGTAPIQRAGMEYEFTVVFDLSQEGHVATATKDRTSLFDGQPHVIDRGTGEALARWLREGERNQEARVQAMLAEVAACLATDELRSWWSAVSAEVKAFTAANAQTVQRAVQVRNAALTEAKAPPAAAPEPAPPQDPPPAARPEPRPKADGKKKPATAKPKPEPEAAEPPAAEPPAGDEDFAGMFKDA